VQLRRKGESFEIVGVVNLGDLYEDMKVLQTGITTSVHFQDIVGDHNLKWWEQYFDKK
jgi:hypothetical protein